MNVFLTFFDAKGAGSNHFETARFSKPDRKGETAFRLRRRERIEGQARQEATKNIKEMRLANHHAQDVVVLQKLAKSNTETESFGSLLGHF